MRKKKAAELPSTENYTIFHALVDVMKDKEEKQDKSLLRRLGLRK